MYLTCCLQVLDDGRITDSQGRTVDFQEYDSDHDFQYRSRLSFGRYKRRRYDRRKRRRIWSMNDLRAHFRPEFLNRLDEIIMFKPLTKENIRAIIDLLVADVNRRLAGKRTDDRTDGSGERLYRSGRRI